MLLTYVPRIERPIAQPGMARLPTVNPSVVLAFREAYRATPMMPSTYTTRTLRSVELMWPVPANTWASSMIIQNLFQ